jgi:hypothetical protein
VTLFKVTVLLALICQSPYAAAVPQLFLPHHLKIIKRMPKHLEGKKYFHIFVLSK